MNKMTDKRNHIVIMAGGIGSRFWPMSTTECPKQFIDVLGVGRSLLQLTYDRFQGICLPENIWIVTNKKYLELCREQLPDSYRKHFVRTMSAQYGSMYCICQLAN